MRKRKILKSAGLIFLLAAVFLFGRATYIYAKAEISWYLLREAWEETLAKQKSVKPWSWADTWPVARLIVPAHEIDLVVLEGDTGNVLAFGPGHLRLSPLPGQPGNSIISGHRDTSFAFLREIRIGEAIRLQRPDGAMVPFRVTATEIIDEAILDIEIDTEAPLLTLVTCYPFDGLIPGGPQRYLVFAEAEKI